jgi:hypothetical protein
VEATLEREADLLAGCWDPSHTNRKRVHPMSEGYQGDFGRVPYWRQPGSRRRGIGQAKVVHALPSTVDDWLNAAGDLRSVNHSAAGL